VSKETIQTADDVLTMLDTLLKEQSRFEWNQFYTDRNKKIPFFKNAPDENLVEYFTNKTIRSGHVLELGCGPGRNAIFLAEKGCTVDAVDSSSEAIQWGKERALERNLAINFLEKNIFELPQESTKYDFIYDSGCFHHIAPHRRMDYLNLLNRTLKPNGHFALTCFVEDGQLGGSKMTDYDVYRERSLKGGLGFTEEKLRRIFADFQVIEIRKMRNVEEQEHVFGVTGLWAGLFKKKG
jgi:cyclopropane fatty-acyl-phospholipid synthase-like methyltransferase